MEALPHDAGRSGTGACRKSRHNRNPNQVCVLLRRRQGRWPRPHEGYSGRQGRRSGRDDQRRIAGTSGIHDPDRSLPGIHARQGKQANRRRDALRTRSVGKVAGTEAGQGRQSAAGLSPLRRQVLNARHDGYDFEPRPERQGRGIARQAQQ